MNDPIAGMDALVSLRTQLRPDLPVFLLIDPMGGDPLPLAADEEDLTRMRQSTWQRPVTNIALTRRVPILPGQHPYLVTLTGPDDPWIDETVVMAQEERLTAQEGGFAGSGAAAHRIGGWLQSEAPVEDLAAFLAASSLPRTDARTNASYLRIGDRRTLALIRHIVGDTRMCAHFGVVQYWGYLDAKGHLASFAGTPTQGASIRFSVEEWKQVRQGEILHPAVAMYLGENALSAQGSGPSSLDTLYAALLRACEEADRAAARWPQRFTSPTDRALWAALFARYSHTRPDGRIGPDDRVGQRLSALSDADEPLRGIYQDIISMLGVRPAASNCMSR